MSWVLKVWKQELENRGSKQRVPLLSVQIWSAPCPLPFTSLGCLMQQNPLPANILAEEHSYTVSPCGKLPEEKRFCPNSVSADSCSRCYRGMVNVSWTVSLDKAFSTNLAHTFVVHREIILTSHFAINPLIFLLRCRQQDSTPARTRIYCATSLPLCCGAGFCWLIYSQQQH